MTCNVFGGTFNLALSIYPFVVENSLRHLRKMIQHCLGSQRSLQ